MNRDTFLLLQTKVTPRVPEEQHFSAVLENNIIDNNIEEDSDYVSTDDEEEKLPDTFLFINGTINNNIIKFFLDTSSKSSSISMNIIEKYNLKEYVKNNTLYIQVIFDNNMIYYIKFKITNNSIIGKDMMKTIGLVIDFNNMQIIFPKVN